MILVVGSTGFLGGMITQRLLAEGRPVRILVRQSSDYQALAHAGAEPVIGDLKDPASLAEACKGVDVIITTANSVLRGGDDNPATVEMQGNKNLIDAAKAAGVGQFIFVSIAGHEPDSPIPFVAGKGQAEDHLAASGMNYTIIAPGAFGEVWLGMAVVAPAMQGAPVTVVGGAPGKTAFISMGDVASFVIASIDHPEAMNQRLLLSGPMAISLPQAAEMLGRLLNREIPVVSVNPGEPVPFLPEATQGLMIGLCLNDYSAPMEELSRTFGVDLTTPMQMLQRMAAPQPQ